MVCLLPLLAVGSSKRLWLIPVPWGAKARTWLALIGAGIVGRVIGYPQELPAEVVWAGIDGLAALAVVYPPKGEAQRAIVLLLIAMMMASLGFFIAGLLQPGPRDYSGIAWFDELLGWIQWACLLSWGVGDALEGVVRRAVPVGYPPLARDGLS